MRKIERRALKIQWRQRILSWKSSGQTGTEWCREQDLVYHQFFYWKNRFDQKAKSIEESSLEKFVEITDENAETPESGISIEYQGVLISLACDFDETTLLRCLQTMRSL